MLQPAITDGQGKAGHDPPPVDAQHIRTSDPDECVAQLRARGMVVRHDQMSEGQYRAELDTVQLPGLRLSRSAYSPAIASLGAPPAGSYAFVLPLSAPDGVFFNHRALGATEIALLRPGEDFLFMRAPGFACATVFVESSVIDTQAAAMFGRSLSRLTPRDRHLLATQTAIAACLRRYAALWGGPGHGPPEGTAPATDIEAQLGHECVDALLRILCPPAPKRGWSARERIVRRAREIVEQDEQGRITVAELCLRIEVPMRTLDDAFRSCLGVPPKRFIDRLRLNHVRRCLSRPEDDTTVTGAATRFGFYHFGRFSDHYQRLFGELPSQTLRRARA